MHGYPFFINKYLKSTNLDAVHLSNIASKQSIAIFIMSYTDAAMATLRYYSAVKNAFSFNNFCFWVAGSMMTYKRLTDIQISDDHKRSDCS